MPPWLGESKPLRKGKKTQAGDWSRFTAVPYLPTHSSPSTHPTPSAAGRPALRVYRAAAGRQCVSVPTVRVRRRAQRHAQADSAVRVRISTPPRGFSATVDERRWRGKQGAPLNGVKSVRFDLLTVFRSRSGKADSSVTIRWVIWSTMIFFSFFNFYTVAAVGFIAVVSLPDCDAEQYIFYFISARVKSKPTNVITT